MRGFLPDDRGSNPEESPGSMGKSPGNAWARGDASRHVTESATEIKPPMAREGSGKGEMVR
jgi:hypothetical protein